MYNGMMQFRVINGKVEYRICKEDGTECSVWNEIQASNCPEQITYFVKRLGGK